ncbi:hypothetical protein QOT17_017531 [Balamuthia mandrillaris]
MTANLVEANRSCGAPPPCWCPMARPSAIAQIKQTDGLHPGKKYWRCARWSCAFFQWAGAVQLDGKQTAKNSAHRTAKGCLPSLHTGADNSCQGLPFVKVAPCVTARTSSLGLLLLQQINEAATVPTITASHHNQQPTTTAPHYPHYQQQQQLQTHTAQGRPPALHYSEKTYSANRRNPQTTQNNYKKEAASNSHPKRAFACSPPIPIPIPIPTVGRGKEHQRGRAKLP